MKSIKNFTLIDDDKLYVYLTSKIIEESKLVEKLTIYDNGMDALNSIKKKAHKTELSPDIILLDLSMPVMDGWKFLHEFLKFNVKNKKKPAIYICSSSNSMLDLIRAKNMPAVTDYIVKPITKDEILNILNQYISES